MEPTFFETPEQFRAWLEENHQSQLELLVGFYKTHTGKPSITWPQSVDEALCFGWIDAHRRSLGAESYVIRFVPRKPEGSWSAVNLKRFPELVAEGRVVAAGLQAWEHRSKSKKSGYTYDGPDRVLGPEEEAEFRRHPAAWEYFQSQAPSYQRHASYRVMSPKNEVTRQKWLRQLIEDSANGRRLEVLTKYSK